MNTAAALRHSTPAYHLGLLPLSADPVTYGHLNLIERAAAQCRELVVLVCENDCKRGSYLFDRHERRALVERAVRRLGCKNVRVLDSDRLLVDEFLETGADVLFRGIRSDKDRAEEERQMRYHNLILPGIATKVVYLEACEELRDVSSTLVKAFASHHLDLTPYVPIFVKAAVEERLCGQWKIGVTGEMASGKTWVTNELARVLNARGYHTHIVNFDELVRDFCAEDSGGAAEARETFASLLGADVLTGDRKNVRLNELYRRLFSPETTAEVRESVRLLVNPQLERLYRAALAKARGIVLVERAQFAELGLGTLVNHRLIVIESPDREEFLRERGVTVTHATNVGRTQLSADRKIELLAQAANRDGMGLILHYENHRADADTTKTKLNALVDEILAHVPKSFAHTL